MVLYSAYPDVDIPKVSFYQYNIDILKQHGDKIALIDGSTDQQLTCNELHKYSINLASALTKRGLKKQEVVALCTSNCIEYPLMVLGVAACNAVTSTCSPFYTIDETLLLFENSQPKFIFTDSSQVNKMKEIAKRISSIQEIFTLEDCKHHSSVWSLINQDDGKNFPLNVTVDVSEDIVFLPYSSGTSGIPKGVMHTHYSCVSVFTLYRILGRVGPQAVAYTCIPMFHVYGFNRTFCYLNGVKNIVEKRFDIQTFLEAVEKHKVSSLSGVPEMINGLLNSPLLDNYDTSSLTSIGCGAAAMSPKLKATVMKKMKLLPRHGYGLTEIGVCASTSGFNFHAISVGYLVPNTKIKVVDPKTRQNLGVNQKGEILIKGPQVMKGYFKNREATAAVFDEGWFCSGDIGHYDENGAIYLDGRLKELIKYKGFQVAPAELEHFIVEHPKVMDVGVVGIKDVNDGEVPKAFVVKKDQSLTANELHQFVEGKVSKYKYLRGGIQFVGKIPRNPTGKILRRKLQEMDVKAVSKL